MAFRVDSSNYHLRYAHLFRDRPWGRDKTRDLRKTQFGSLSDLDCGWNSVNALSQASLPIRYEENMPNAERRHPAVMGLD